MSSMQNRSLQGYEMLRRNESHPGHDLSVESLEDLSRDTNSSQSANTAGDDAGRKAATEPRRDMPYSIGNEFISHKAVGPSLRPEKPVVTIGVDSTEEWPRQKPANATWSTIQQWWQEWIFMLFSACILVAIVVVLREFNHKPQPDWKLGLNLSTLIAVLATLLRSTLMSVVEEVISQAKWSWIRYQRPVSQLAHLDNASRGPVGAFLLCFRIPALLRWRSLSSGHSHSALLASVVVVLSLAIGAFMQQAIRNIPCDISVPGSNATIAVAQFAHPWLNDTKLDWDSWALDSSTKTRIISALSSRNVTRPTFLQNCTTGNCTFSPVNGVTHVTSGFCSRCVETTKSLRYERNFTSSRNMTIRSILRLESSPSLLLAFEPLHAISIGMAVNGDKNALQALRGSIPDNFTAAINIASLTEADCPPGTQCSNLWNETRSWGNGGWGQYNMVSVSCGLYPCARYMTAEVSNGEFRETVLREELFETYGSDRTETFGKAGNWTFRKPVAFRAPCWVNGTRYEKPPGNLTVTTDGFGHNVNISKCAFGVSEAFDTTVRVLMRSITSGNCSVSSTSTEPECRADEMLDDNFCNNNISPICKADLWWLQNLYNSGQASFESISNTMDNVAMAITDGARTQPFPGISYVPGTIWNTTICTEINWPWLTFPAAMIILAGASLASIASWNVWSQHGAPVWKSSILPLILQDGHEWGMSTKGSYTSDLKQDADKNELILKRENDRWEIRVKPMVEGMGRRESL